MTNSKVSDLTVTTTFAGTDLVPIVQGGVSKRIAASDFLAEVTPASASETTEGIVERATNTEVAAATDTTKYVSPAGMRHGGANETFDKIVLDGATGSSSTGDINIPGNFKNNGVTLPTVMQFTPVAFLSSPNCIIPVDFTTYAAYKLIINRLTSNSNISIAASSNGGVGYTSFQLNGHSITNGTPVVTASITAIPTLTGTLNGSVEMVFSQPSVGGNVQVNMTGNPNTSSSFILGGYSLLTAAADRIRLTDGGGNFSTNGFYTLVPMIRR